MTDCVEETAAAVVTAYGNEMILTVPSHCMFDIYRLHQVVWERVVSGQYIKVWHPSILFRRDGPLVRVRVSNTAMATGAPVTSVLCQGSDMSVDVHIALWRSMREVYGTAYDRAKTILGEHGLELGKAHVTCGVARGWKGRIGAHIELPVARIEGAVRITDARAAANAWKLGVGRGKRFGFGMLQLR